VFHWFRKVVSVRTLKVGWTKFMPNDTTRQSVSSAPLFVGVDVGGTNIKLGVVNDLGELLGSDTTPTESERGVPDAIERVVNRIRALTKKQGVGELDIAAVGLATPGTMDLRAGLILEPPNLPGWRHFPIRDALRDAYGKPVFFANDATAAGFGEFWVGSGRKCNSIVLLTLGTGVGAGIILDSRTIDGEHDHGSEVGHIPIAMGTGARRCNCGQAGHLEAYCSATAVVRRAQELLELGAETAIRDRLSPGKHLTAKMIYEEAERSDKFCWDLIQETADYLAVGILSVAHTLDPAMIVLGGAMNFGGADSPVGRAFLDRVRQEFRRQTFPVLAAKTRIDFAQLGSDAGIIGAAGLAREAHSGRQSRLC
jgi:glucokinase